MNKYEISNNPRSKGCSSSELAKHYQEGELITSWRGELVIGRERGGVVYCWGEEEIERSIYLDIRNLEKDGVCK